MHEAARDHIAEAVQKLGRGEPMPSTEAPGDGKGLEKLSPRAAIGLKI